jgi:hypothetical protein
VKEVHEIFDFVGLENISERGHGGTAVVDLMFDFLLAEAFADGAQIGAEISAAAICAMAVLTPFFMKERGSGFLAVA